MSDEADSFLGVFRAHLADWFERAFPAELGRKPGETEAEDDEASETRRQSIHDVTLEQLGISHWSYHSHF